MNFFAEVYEQVAAETEQDTSPVDGDMYPERQQAAITPAPVAPLNLHQALDANYDLAAEVRRYGRRTFSVWIGSDSGEKRLLCVTVYKKGAHAVKNQIDRLVEQNRNLAARLRRYEQLHQVA